MSAVLSFLGGPVYWLMAWLLAMSLVLFFTMAYDKGQAVRGGRRVPEKRLFFLALLGGGIGGFFGMYAFRHKTRHMKFVLLFPAIALLQAAACIYLYVNLL